MYLKKLHIKNFRCFSDYEIEFAPRVTVLFGKNGSGKTTLIHAMHKAMSMFMYSEKIKAKDPKTKKLKPIGENSIRSGNPYLKVEGFSLIGDQHSQHTVRGSYMIDITAEALLDSETKIDWAMNAYAINCRLRPSEFKDAFYTLYDWHQRTDKRPLLAYFSDGYPHVAINGSATNDRSKEAFHVKSDMPEVGYTEWNSDKGFTSTWIMRLRKKLLSIDSIPRNIKKLEQQHKEGIVGDDNYSARMTEENKEFSACINEVNAILSCLQTFFKGDNFYEISDVTIDGYRHSEVFVVTTSGKRIALDDLPAGYKRMLFMALDIAYRSYMLSGMKTTDVEGLVIIDEIDLHLHPELEQCVLERFMRTFTKAQFVVSTHSPAVLTDLETKNGENVVLKMSAGESAPEKWADVHGIDYNLMLEEGMGVTKRKPEIQTLFDKAWAFIGEKNVEAAKSVLSELEQKTPADQTELVRLRALINRIELIGR